MNSSILSSVLIGAALAMIIGGAGWVIAAGADSVPRTGVRLESSRGAEPVYVTVKAGDTASDIGMRLQDAGIIESAGSFKLLAQMTGASRTLAAGEYEFEQGTSTLDALTRIRDGLTAARVVTIPEGMRIEQVAALLEERGVVKASDFLVAANGIATSGTQVDADLLSSRPSATTLEGYIFPATYSFSRSVTAQEVVLTMVKALGDRFTNALRADARAQGLTVHQVLTLASIVEREDVIPEERPLIASVYRNRIAQGMPLQADPTVQYAVTARPGNVDQFGYWKKVLSLQDLQFDSSYNTYLKGGMPPGPIANPGLESILAVIHPAQTDYLFFVARNDGSHAFAATFEEHQRNVAQYQP